MKVALIQDQLLTSAGSERVFLAICKVFPEADVFTFCYNDERTWPEFKNINVRTHWAGRFVKSHSQFKIAFPIILFLMMLWDFRKYDLVITSSASTAKYVRRIRGRHVCYCYFPTRAIWHFEKYFKDGTGVSGWLFSKLLPIFKWMDYRAAQRVSKFIAISQTSRNAISEFYNRSSDVLFCPVDLDRFKPPVGSDRLNHFLIVSRLENWKLLDYAIEAFNVLGLPLTIVGTGPEEERLRSIAKPNVLFLGALNDDDLIAQYRSCRAVIFTPELEYGLVPVEAVASGAPVIALRRGGVIETMEDAALPGANPVAILFDEPNAKSLIAAIQIFNESVFFTDQLIAHARQFGFVSFRDNLKRMSAI